MDAICIQKLKHEQCALLLRYLDSLSDETKGRFGPHAFTLETIESLAINDGFELFIATDNASNHIIAYTIVKYGWIDFEAPRLSTYGFAESNKDATFAPSVADQWQSKGIGSLMFKYILYYLKDKKSIERIFLWGGVQNTNIKALNFYHKLGFKTLGQFEYHGLNTDMMLELKSS